MYIIYIQTCGKSPLNNIKQMKQFLKLPNLAKFENNSKLQCHYRSGKYKILGGNFICYLEIILRNIRSKVTKCDFYS